MITFSCHCEEAVRPTRQSRVWIASLTLAMTNVGRVAAVIGVVSSEGNNG